MTLLPCQVTITGIPVVSFEFIGLPSINTHYNQNRWAKSKAVAEWRYEAREKALEWMIGHAFEGKYPVNRALVVVNFYPPHEEISDCHNVLVKPVLDGFTEAGLYHDDEWAFMPLVVFRWAGFGTQKPRTQKTRKTTLDIYELDTLKIGGEYMILPKGRRWVADEYFDEWMES